MKRRRNILLALAATLALAALVMAAAGLLLAFRDEAAGGSPQASGPAARHRGGGARLHDRRAPRPRQRGPRGVERRPAGLGQGQENPRQPRDEARAAALAPPRGVGDGAAGTAGGVRHRHQRRAPWLPARPTASWPSVSSS